MKIQKIALSFLAIAISSTAFASTSSSDTQAISDQIRYAFINGQSTYDIVSSVAGADVYAGSRGDDQSEIQFTSAQKDFLVKNIVLPIRAAMCEESFRALRNGEADAERFNNLPAESSELSVKSLEAIKASSLVASCAFINQNTHRIELLGLNDGEVNASRALHPALNFDIAKGVAKTADEYLYKGVPISKEQFESGVAAFFAGVESAKSFDMGSTVSNIITPDHFALLESQANSPIYDGGIKLAAEFKAQEIAKAISEFNALQQLALNESDPAVKALIKQAADLKLASYRK